LWSHLEGKNFPTAESCLQTNVIYTNRLKTATGQIVVHMALSKKSNKPNFSKFYIFCTEADQTKWILITVSMTICKFGASLFYAIRQTVYWECSIRKIHLWDWPRLREKDAIKQLNKNK
jgi:hypothetical protein